MVKTTKRVLVLLLVIVLTDTKPAMYSKECSNVIDCLEDEDCACLNLSHSKLICNYKFRCDTMGFYDEIVRKQPCFRVYKRRCLNDDDCPCDEARLICEHSECIKARSIPALGHTTGTRHQS